MAWTYLVRLFSFMRPFFTLSLLLLFTAGLAAQPSKDIRVLSESATSIVIEFTPSFANRTVPEAMASATHSMISAVQLRTVAFQARL